MITEQERVAMMTDEERVAFAKNLKIEDYEQIPAYWKEHLEQKIRQIHERQLAAGRQGTSFGLIADFHFTCNSLRSPALMEKVLADCGIPYFFMAGDFVSGMGVITPENLINEIVTVRRLFARIGDKALAVQGNHDPAYSTFSGEGYVESLTKEQIYEYMFRPQAALADRVFGDGGYFYADDKNHKVRYIGLDSHDTPNDDLGEDGKPVYGKMTHLGFCQKQLEWFADVALDVPGQDWTVVLCTHETVVDEQETYHNRELVLGLIDAFRKHTSFEGFTEYAKIPLYNAWIKGDFTGGGGDFAVWAGGHTHRDLEERRGGILLTTSASDSFNDIGSVEEQAFDIFTINKKEHKLYITRIGRGGDREFAYEVF